MKKAFSLPLIIIILMFVLPLAMSIHINEVMYNPLGDDNNKEFIEIKGTSNLSGYMIGDSAANDSLVLLQYSEGNFSLIVEEGFNYSNLNCSVYSAGSTIGNNLNNDADTIFLYYQGMLIDFMSYNNSKNPLANNNGYSLELIGGEWVESCKTGGSPGEENCIKIYEDEKEGALNINNNYTQDYTQEQNNSEMQNISIRETNEINNSIKPDNTSFIDETENYCFITINLSTDKQVYDEGERIQIKNSLSSTKYSYVIEYWVEDLFGNEVKKRMNTTNTNIKTYTASIKENDKAFLVKNRLVFVNCNNANTKLENEKLIVVRKINYSNFEEEVEEKKKESSINISKIYFPSSGGLRFGDELKVKLSIYKGNTSKSLISAFVEDEKGKKVSETTDFYIEKKYSEYELSVKVLLKQDCKLESKEYLLVIEGLGERVDEGIFIEQNTQASCKQATNLTNKNKINNNSKQINASSSVNSSKQSVSSESEEGKIVSFYTRTQNFKESIRLYANIQAKTPHTVVLLSGSKDSVETQVMDIIDINGSAKLSFNVSVKPGLNFFTLELRKKGSEEVSKKVVDSKNLSLNFNLKTNSSGLMDSSLGTEKMIEKGRLDLESEPNKTVRENDSLTGMIVYESGNLKIAKKIPWLLVPLAVLVFVGVMLQRKR